MSQQPLPYRLRETALWLRTAASQIVSPASIREEWLDRARACEEAAVALGEQDKAKVAEDMKKLRRAACGP